MSVTNGKLSPTFSDGRVHSGLKSQRQFFESEWGPHDADFHPAKLKLHVERRAKNAQVESSTLYDQDRTTVRLLIRRFLLFSFFKYRFWAIGGLHTKPKLLQTLV